MFRCIVLSLLIFISSNSFSQIDSVDFFMQTIMKQRGIPGAQIAIIKNGKIFKIANYGFASIQDSIPVSNNTLFTINSMTKAFVGVAVMQLVEQKKIDLVSPISKYLKGEIPAKWHAITVKQLLSHTSGIPDVFTNSGELLVVNNFQGTVDKVKQLPLNFSPGSKFQYCQTNAYLIGRIISKCSNVNYQDLIKENQIVKTNMVNTLRAGFFDASSIVNGLARGYGRSSNGSLVNLFETFPVELRTGAGLATTAGELAKWLIDLQSGKFFESTNTLSTLWEPVRLINGNTGGFGSLLNAWGLGFPIANREDHLAIASIGGNRSAMFYYLKDSLGIIVLTNLAGAVPESFMDEIGGFFYPDMKEVNGFHLSKSLKLLQLTYSNDLSRDLLSIVRNLKKVNRYFSLTEDEINSWGYKERGEGNIKKAILIFQLNTALFPSSGNTFDSLAETYAESNQVAMAIENYRKALKLDPKNTNAINQLKALKSKLK